MTSIVVLPEDVLTLDLAAAAVDSVRIAPKREPPAAIPPVAYRLVP
ncbi:MAG TPA: hypothetical protein VH063_06395 [Gaiellaceae bacterium]|jgi:hypothetical protein|nr:hypothetical protein [Gaiellaceae bacterium]